MAFLPATKTVPEAATWELKCQYCGGRVASLDHTEILDFIVWLATNAELVSCFECDPVGADEIPGALRDHNIEVPRKPALVLLV